MYKINNPFVYLLLLILVCSICLTACGLEATAQTAITPSQPQTTLVIAATPSPSPASTLRNEMAQWLKNSGCRMPCWEGILPGTTTLDEAMPLLKKSSLVATSSIKTDGNRVYWTYNGKNASDGSGQLFSSAASASPTIVFKLSPYFTTSLSFWELIDLVGEPSHIMIIGQPLLEKPGNIYSIHIVYLNLGLIFEKTVTAANKTMIPVLNKALTLENPTLFNPTSLDNVAGPTFAKSIMVWEGFKDFGYYCRSILDDTGKTNCDKLKY